MEAIVNTLIKATGWSIFHSLWQGAIVYGILLLIVYGFPKINAKTKHNMAYSALCVIFIGFCITFLSIFKWPSGVTENVTVINGNFEVPTGYLVNLPQQINSQTEYLFPYLVGVYVLGLFLQLFVLGKGYLKLARLKKSPGIEVPYEWLTVFQTMVTKLNLHQKIRFHLSPSVNVPLVIGYLKPVVLFPVSLVSQLDIAQVEAILIHELSHIRRNDYLLNMIKTGIETILFFNPFIWLSGKLINIEREHACDDLVLKFTGTPITYAHALLKLEILKDKSSPSFAMASTGNNQHLYQRIKRITDMKTNYMNAKQQILAITLTLATVISLAWVSPTKTSNELKTALNSGKEEIVKVLNKTTGNDLFCLDATASSKDAVSDTTKKKQKVKIITVDANGNKKEYNSMKDVPDSLKFDLALDSSFKFKFMYDNFQGLDSLTRLSTVYLRSPEFKAQLKAQLKAQTDYVRSPEFKALMKDHADLAKANAVEIRKHLNSPEYKKQIIELSKLAKDASLMALKSTDFKALQLDALKELSKVRLEFNSEEIKKEIENARKLQNSPEYKKLKEQFDKDLEKLKEDKGIK